MVENRPFRNLLAHVILWIGIVVVAFPVYLAFVGSTHDAATIVNGQMPLTPAATLVENYYRDHLHRHGGTTREPVGTMLFNSFVMAMVIARRQDPDLDPVGLRDRVFPFPFRMTAFWMIFITLMLPVEVRIYPTYKIVADLNMLDTYAGLTLPLIASATATLLFRQFFMTVPDELVEASQHRRRRPVPLFLGHAAAARAHQHGGAVRDPVHLRLEPVPLAAADHHARRHADHRDRHQEDDRHVRRADRMALVMATAMLAMLPPVLVVIAECRSCSCGAGGDGEVRGVGWRVAGRAIHSPRYRHSPGRQWPKSRSRTSQGLRRRRRSREGRHVRRAGRAFLRAGRPVGLRQVDACCA